MSPAMAEAIGLSPDVAIVIGAHDQCANAVAGVRRAWPYGLGTFTCITPTYGPFRPPGR